jgi:two-component sensor histidine kinase
MASQELIASPINGLPSQIAILDAGGAIVDVNDAWRRFSVQNGACHPKAYLGTNYLDICRRAAAAGDELASKVLVGVSSVISSGIPRFTQRYTCDAREMPRWFRMTVTRVPSGSGVLIAHDDVSALVRAETAFAELERKLTLEEQRRLRVQETEYRSKNLLALVLAIARQDAPSAEEFAYRVDGISASLRLLSSSGWKGVNPSKLVQSQIAPLAGPLANRVAFRGPELLIRAPAVQALGMAFHELAKNSLRNGALSGKEGRIHVQWDARSDGQAPLFQMVWSESGGPQVEAPSSVGFGHMVTVTAVEAATGGKVSLEYPSSGLIWKLAVPLETVVLPH